MTIPKAKPQTDKPKSPPARPGGKPTWINGHRMTEVRSEICIDLSGDNENEIDLLVGYLCHELGIKADKINYGGAGTGYRARQTLDYATPKELAAMDDE